MKRSKKTLPNNKLKAFVGFLIAAIVLTTISYVLINKVVKNTTEINRYTSLATDLTGLNGKRNILILFMNNAEMRYGGGFIGTVAYVTVDKGKLSSEPVRSVYYYDHLYDQIKYNDSLASPRSEDLQYLTLRNSGLNLDWPVNGNRAREIFEKESGKSVDYVLAVTPETLKYILKYIGPLKLSDYDKTITPENIIDSVQTEVEFGDDKKSGKDPKTILSSIANELIDKLSHNNLSQLEQVAQGFPDLIAKKQIILFANNKNIQQDLKRLKMAGNLERFDGDYLQIAEDNLSIDKSSAFIERTLNKEVIISESGEVSIRLDIGRTQSRAKSIEYIDPHNDRLTYLIKENKSQLSLAVPKGSLITKDYSNVELRYRSTEAGVDIYDFMSSLEPFIPSNYKISYKLPFRLSVSDKAGLTYNSFVQLQNGGWPYKLKTIISVPPGWQLLASSQKDVYSANGKNFYDTIIGKDQFSSFVYAKR